MCTNNFILIIIFYIKPLTVSFKGFTPVILVFAQQIHSEHSRHDYRRSKHLNKGKRFFPYKHSRNYGNYRNEICKGCRRCYRKIMQGKIITEKCKNRGNGSEIHQYQQNFHICKRSDISPKTFRIKY